MADIYHIETQQWELEDQIRQSIEQGNKDASLFPYEDFQKWQDEHVRRMEQTQAEINRALCERGRV